MVSANEAYWFVRCFSTKAIPTENQSSVWVEGTLTAPPPRMEQGHGHRPAARSPVQQHTLQQRLRPLAVQLNISKHQDQVCSVRRLFC